LRGEGQGEGEKEVMGLFPPHLNPLLPGERKIKEGVFAGPGNIDRRLPRLAKSTLTPTLSPQGRGRLWKGFARGSARNDFLDGTDGTDGTDRIDQTDL